MLHHLRCNSPSTCAANPPALPNLNKGWRSIFLTAVILFAAAKRRVSYPRQSSLSHSTFVVVPLPQPYALSGDTLCGLTHSPAHQPILEAPLSSPRRMRARKVPTSRRPSSPTASDPARRLGARRAFPHRLRRHLRSARQSHGHLRGVRLGPRQSAASDPEQPGRDRSAAHLRRQWHPRRQL